MSLHPSVDPFSQLLARLQASPVLRAEVRRLLSPTKQGVRPVSRSLCCQCQVAQASWESMCMECAEEGEG